MAIRFLNAEKQSNTSFYILLDDTTKPDKLFSQCHEFFKSHPKEQVVPIRNQNKELIYLAYNDKRLDPFLKILDIIRNNPNWYFLEALFKYHDFVFLSDCNELTYYLSLYMRNINIPFVIANPKWTELFNITRSLGINVLSSPIVLNEETKYQPTVDSIQRLNPDICYAFLNTIFRTNVFLDYLQLKKCDYNRLECKKLLFKYLKERNITLEYVRFNICRVSYNDLLSFLDEKNIGMFINCISLATRKKIAAILCNCQGEPLAELLEQELNFSNDYYILQLPPYWQIRLENIKNLPSDIFKNFDLLIYQYVKKTFAYPFFSSDNILKLLKKSCRHVCIPDIYFDGYFPQTEHLDKPNDCLIEVNGETIFHARDYYIEKEYASTRSISATIARLSEQDYLERDTVIKHWNTSVQTMIEHEKYADITMSDYVIIYGRERQLFYAAHNPVQELIYEEAIRILDFLSIQHNPVDYSKITSFENVNQLIYPFVVKALCLKFNPDGFYCNKLVYNKKLSFEHFVELYIRIICEIK